MKETLCITLLLVGGCKNSKFTGDFTGPTVNHVEPQEYLVAPDATFTVTFSEEISDDSAQSKYFTLMLADEFTDTQRKALSMGSASMLSKAAAIIDITSTDNNRSIVIQPRNPLKAHARYYLLLSAKIRDRQGNPLVGPTAITEPFIFPFATSRGVSKLIGHDFFSEGDPLVSPNRRIFTLFFDAELEISADTLTLTSLVRVPKIKFISQNRQQKSVNFTVASNGEGCDIWQNNSEYTLLIRSSTTAGQKEATTSLAFRTASFCDLSDLRGPEPSWAIASEKSALVQLATTRTGTARIWFGAEGGDLDCLGQPCPVIIEKSGNPMSPAPFPYFLHSLELTGTSAGRNYQYQAVLEDDRRQHYYDQGIFTTLSLPKIAISEVMANPKLPSGVSEFAAEYIELLNLETRDLRLDGYRIVVGKEGSFIPVVCEIPFGSVIGPGQYLTITGDAFLPDYYRDIPMGGVVRMPNKSVCGQLSNTSPVSIELKDEQGRLISSFRPKTASSQEGRSIERDLSDVANFHDEHFCWSRSDMGPSPGRINSIMIKGCE